MGFPVSEETIEACGFECGFSQRRPGPPSRSMSSQRHQIGNTIHVANISCVVAAIILKLPMLGEAVPPVVATRKADSSSGVSLGVCESLRLFREKKRRR